MNTSKVIEYLTGDNVGLSSRALVRQYCMGKENKNRDYPRDCGDLERCILAVESLGLEHIKFMESISLQWSNISKKWDELTRTINYDRNECYFLLRECIEGIN